MYNTQYIRDYENKFAQKRVLSNLEFITCVNRDNSFLLSYLCIVVAKRNII